MEKNHEYGSTGHASSERKKIGLILLAVLILLCTVFIISRRGRSAGEASGDLTLNVALYPYVPDIERMEKAIGEDWAAQHPDVKLNFSYWDCYSGTPTEELDVFVFDSIYMTELAEQGYLLPIPEEKINNKEDILPYALEGCKERGTLYGIPQLLCTNLLYTRKEDEELNAVTDIVTLYEKLGDRKIDTVVPEENEGLLIDMSGGTTKMVMYLDAQIDESHTYTEQPDLPDKDHFSQEALDVLKMMYRMGGGKQATYEAESDDFSERARWFSEGKGRAFIGYSEAMVSMGAYADEVVLRPYSYNAEGDVSLFTCDAAGINSKISEEKKELAYDLVNVITGEDTVFKSIAADGEHEEPQYLLPARAGVYERLGESSPAYRKLGKIVSNPENRVFRIGAEAREYIANTKKALAALIFAPSDDPENSAEADTEDPLIDSGTAATVTESTTDPLMDSGAAATVTESTADPLMDSGAASTATGSTADPLMDSGAAATVTESTADPLMETDSAATAETAVESMMKNTGETSVT